MDITIEVVTVTPDTAREWLQRNTKNRSLNKRRVSDYARDIASGAWKINGESIKFDVDGNLLDGQHRLAAVVEADMPTPFVVVTDLDPSTQSTVDTGRKRTMTDVLAINGTVNAPIVSAIAKRALMWERGDRKFSGNMQPTHAELLRFIERTPSVYRSAEIASRTRNAFKPMPQSTAGLTHHLFNQIDTGATAEFFALVQTGANLTEGHPILVLRNRYMLDLAEGKRLTDKVRIGLVIKAWNAFRKDETMSKIVMIDDGIMPEPI